MLKVYGIIGRTTALLTIPTANRKAFVKAEFKHGRMGVGIASKPATFSTSDPVVQDILEMSPEYTSGLIKLVRAYSDNGALLSPVELAKLRKCPAMNGIAAVANTKRIAKASAAPQAQIPAPVDPRMEPVELAEEEPVEQGVAPVELAEEDPVATAGEALVEAIPSVTTYTEAAAFLKSRGAKASEIRSTDAALKYAAKIGVTFPNFKA